MPGIARPVVLMPINGDVKLLHAGGPPVGIFPNATYQMQEVVLPLGVGPRAFYRWDPEATNAENEEFGEDRLIGICQTERSQSAKQLVKDLLNAREAWAHATSSKLMI